MARPAESAASPPQGRVVVTGASRGIGYAVVAAFMDAGLDAFITARDPQRLATAARQLTARYPGSKLTHQAADLANKAEVTPLAEAILADPSPIAVLVNNAGRFVPDDLLQSEDRLEEQLAVNLLSATRLTRCLLPRLVAQGRGDVFNICSVASLHAYPGGASYSIAKHALLGFSRVLREALKPHGLRVCAVLPGAVLTDSWAGTSLPAERFIAPEDVASALLAAHRMSAGANLEELLLRPQGGDL